MTPKKMIREYTFAELLTLGPIKIDSAVTWHKEGKKHVFFILEDGSRGVYKHKV